MVAAAERGDEQRHDRDERDRDDDRKPAASGLSELTLVAGPNGMPLDGRRHRPDRSGPLATLQPVPWSRRGRAGILERPVPPVRPRPGGRRRGPTPVLALRSPLRRHARYFSVRHGTDRRADDGGRSSRTLPPMSAFPATRLRRLRRSPALRDLVRETPLALGDLVMPLFVAPEPLRNERLPGLSRHSVEGVVRECEELLRAGVTSVLLFGIPEAKDEEGSGAWIADGIVQQALRALRQRFPELLLLTDVCLASTRPRSLRHLPARPRRRGGDRQRRLGRADRAHGRLARRGRRGRCLPERHDGRPGGRDSRRPARDADRGLRGEVRVGVLRPFPRGGRIGAVVRRPPRLPDGPGNAREALRECELDIAEGADVLMVKPALAYLDVIRAVRDRFDLPLAAYNVCGEYAMIKAAAAAGESTSARPRWSR